MSKRHFGSVRRFPSGRYQAAYWHDGKRHVADQMFATKGDALAHLASIEIDLRRGAWVNPADGNLSIELLAREWLDSNPSKRPDTQATDEYHLKCHILPELGNKRIREVTPRMLQQVVNDLAARLAPKTVSRAVRSRPRDVRLRGGQRHAGALAMSRNQASKERSSNPAHAHSG